MDIKIYTSSLHQFLMAVGDEAIAIKQSQYMRNRFPFIGLMKDQQDKYWKEFQEIHGRVDAQNAIEFCRQCMRYTEREMWYIGMKTLIKHKNKLKSKDIDFVRTLIIESDWWDIVDLVSSHLVGTLYLQYPEIQNTVDQWIYDENMWLRRSALIYQLQYKAKTNEEKLYGHILLACSESEFFIRKAIGWSLREYSKHNPKSVQRFIETHRDQLSTLSLKEGSKYLFKK